MSTYDDSRENTLRCGEALSRVLLECTAMGFATCTLTHMIELHASREIVRRLSGRRAEPQVLVRVGPAAEGGPPAVRTPRRPLTDILHIL
jgi:nitroreductase